MIDKPTLTTYVNNQLEGSDYYLVDIIFEADNRIVIEIDSNDPVDVDFCATLSRSIVDEFTPEIDDYELEVGSAGLTSPFKVLPQYIKNIGNDVEVLTTDGKKLEGVLKEANDDSFIITITKKVKEEGSKRPVMREEDVEIPYEKVKYTKYLLQF
jgi:ribosome maturation factor RimP